MSCSFSSLSNLALWSVLTLENSWISGCFIPIKLASWSIAPWNFVYSWLAFSKLAYLRSAFSKEANVRSTSFRLWPEAPFRISFFPFPFLLFSGTSIILSAILKYAAPKNLDCLYTASFVSIGFSSALKSVISS